MIPVFLPVGVEVKTVARCSLVLVVNWKEVFRSTVAEKKERVVFLESMVVLVDTAPLVSKVE